METPGTLLLDAVLQVRAAAGSFSVVLSAVAVSSTPAQSRLTVVLGRLIPTSPPLSHLGQAVAHPEELIRRPLDRRAARTHR